MTYQVHLNILPWLGDPYSFFLVLSFTQCQQLLFSDNLQYDGDIVMGSEEDDDGWEDEGLSRLPPGEEGFLQSHAGSEALLQEIFEGMTSRSVFYLSYFSLSDLLIAVSELMPAHGEIVFSNE